MSRTAGRTKKAQPKRLEAIYIDGKAFCPLCKTRNFSGIEEYSLADAKHRHIGTFKFVVKCLDCGNLVTYYKSL